MEYTGKLEIEIKTRFRKFYAIQFQQIWNAISVCDILCYAIKDPVSLGSILNAGLFDADFNFFFQIQTFLICYFSPGLTFVSLASLFTTCVQMEHSAKFNHVPNDIALDAKLTGNFACNGNLIFPHQRTRINLQLTGKILNTCNYTLLKSNSEKI